MSKRSPRIRAMTFNIKAGSGSDGSFDLHRTAEAIRSQQPDVVGLQEVDRHYSERSEFLDEASVLASELDMHSVFAANLDLDPPKPEGARRQYGLAVLSRYPLAATSHHLLPCPANGEQRGLLSARIDLGDASLLFCVTHLQFGTGDKEDERSAQVRAVLDLLKPETEPTILVGDFNAGPDDASIAPFFQEYEDAWRLAGEGPGYTFEASRPTSRIDYMLLSRDITPRSICVPATIASDHRPVVADLEIG